MLFIHMEEIKVYILLVHVLNRNNVLNHDQVCVPIIVCSNFYAYSKTPLSRPPLSLRKKGLYSGVVLLLSYDKDEINEM